jgi:SLT domain-containing protein
MQSYGQGVLEDTREEAASLANQPVRASYKHGGTVRKTGLAKVHRGEYVVPAHKARKAKKLLKRKSGRGM